MFIDQISSKDNPRIKEILLLQEKSKARREKGRFVVEGLREITHCIEGGFRVESIFFCEELLPKEKAIALAQSAASGDAATDTDTAADTNTGADTDTDSDSAAIGAATCADAAGADAISAAATSADATGAAATGAAAEMSTSTALYSHFCLFAVTRQIYQKIAYRDSTEGIVALIRSTERRIDDIVLGKSPLVLVFEGVEKPGNLGAVLRTADAAGVDAVFVCDSLTDLYNPNLIRASLGGVFTVPVVACSGEEAALWLHERGFTIYSAQLQDSKPYYQADMTGATAIVFGSEATGLTPFWRHEASSHIMIPMLGRLDSLNVSVSAAILCYEAVRQRNLSK